MVNNCLDNGVLHPIFDKSPYGDVVVFSKVELHRNISNQPFCWKLTGAGFNEIKSLVKEGIDNSSLKKEFNLYEIENMDKFLIDIFVDQGVISKGFVVNSSNIFYTNDLNNISILVNDRDHLTYSSKLNGFNITNCVENVLEVDRVLENEIDYAFDLELGYLYPEFKRVGSGLKMEVVLYLVGMTYSSSVVEVSDFLTREGFYVKNSSYGSEINNFYSLTFENMGGVSEDEIVEEFENKIKSIIKLERLKREAVPKDFRNKVKKDFQMIKKDLKQTTKMSYSEAEDFISKVKKAISFGVGFISYDNLNTLSMLIKDSHLIMYLDGINDPNLIEIKRADLLKELFLGKVPEVVCIKD